MNKEQIKFEVIVELIKLASVAFAGWLLVPLVEPFFH